MWRRLLQFGKNEVGIHFAPRLYSLVEWMWTNRWQGGGVCGKLTSCELRMRAAETSLIHQSCFTLRPLTVRAALCFTFRWFWFRLPPAIYLRDKSVSQLWSFCYMKKKIYIYISCEFIPRLTFCEGVGIWWHWMKGLEWRNQHVWAAW